MCERVHVPPSLIVSLALASDLSTHRQCLTSVSPVRTEPSPPPLPLSASCCSCVILLSCIWLDLGLTETCNYTAIVLKLSQDWQQQKHNHGEGCGCRYTLLEGGLGDSQVKQRCFSWNWRVVLWAWVLWTPAWWLKAMLTGSPGLKKKKKCVKVVLTWPGQEGKHI